MAIIRDMIPAFELFQPNTVDDALALLDELLTPATQEKYQYRHKWRLGDLVIWDNRCLPHKANDDYDMSQLRYLYRVMLKGDKPI